MPDNAIRSKVSLKLATWNIHCGIGSDRRQDMQRIASVLGSIDADVIGLQEVGWHRRSHRRVDQFAYLREHTGYDVVEGLVRDPRHTRFGNALLTRIPVRETWRIDLTITGHAPRGALAVELGTDAAPMRVVVAHLGLTPWERQRQARRLIDALTQDTGTMPPTALIGDFNIVRANTRASQVLAGHFPICARMPTFPTRKPILCLDRIYLSSDWELAGVQVLGDELALQASDHLPLVVDVQHTAKRAI
jgi:endonuclease/exonuclease/phosphatase family metal-dependent hydrolase